MLVNKLLLFCFVLFSREGFRAGHKFESVLYSSLNNSLSNSEISTDLKIVLDDE